MIRTGIYKFSQLSEKKLIDFFGKNRNISLLLYFQQPNSKEQFQMDKYSEAILNRFNSKDNIVKCTYRNRFNKFDDLCIKIIQDHRFQSVKIHDLAIADGRASIYLLRKLMNLYEELEYHGSDLSLFYYLYEIKENFYIVTYEQKKIIESTKAPFVWNYSRKEGMFYWINNFLKMSYKKKYTNVIKKNKLKYNRKLSLIDCEFLEILQGNPKFQLSNYDLFEKSNSNYNIVRAMNILHFGYFNRSQLKEIIFNIHNSLNLEGLFIEGSNEDAGTEVEGAIYKKTNNRFECLISSSKPSRIKDVVMNFKI